MADVTKLPCVYCGFENPVIAARCGNPECRRRDPLVPPKADDPIPEVAPAPVAVTGGIAILLPDFTRVVVEPGHKTEFGRECGNEAIDLALEPYPDVHRHHFTIRNLGEGPTIADASTRNGTWLDDARLEPGVYVPISPGQRIRLASRCFLKVELP